MGSVQVGVKVRGKIRDAGAVRKAGWSQRGKKLWPPSPSRGGEHAGQRPGRHPTLPGSTLHNSLRAPKRAANNPGIPGGQRFPAAIRRSYAVADRESDPTCAAGRAGMTNL